VFALLGSGHLVVYCECFYEQYADICFSYGFWNGNISAVVAKYCWQFLSCRFPSRSALSNWEKLGHSTQVSGNVPYKKLIVRVAALIQNSPVGTQKTAHLHVNWTLWTVSAESCVEEQLVQTKQIAVKLRRQPNEIVLLYQKCSCFTLPEIFFCFSSAFNNRYLEIKK